MRMEDIMKVLLVTAVLLVSGACCVIGGPLTDGPEIELRVSALWNEATPPPGSSATVDFYVLAEGESDWTVLELDVPYPNLAGVLVDTFRYNYDVPITGERVTYRYEVDMIVGGVTYRALEYPEALVCEGGTWWWYFGGRVLCSETGR